MHGEEESDHMLLRNYIQLGIFIFVILGGLITFFAIKHKASGYESEISVHKKKELKGKLK